MDVRTLFVTIGLAYGILAVLLIVSERPRWGTPTGWLALAYSLGSAGVLLQAGRGVLTITVAIVLGNLLTWLGLQAQAWAALSMAGRPVATSVPWLVAGSTVACGLPLLVLSPAPRTTVSLAIYAICFAISAGALLAWRDAPGLLRATTTAVLVLLAGMYAARSIAVATGTVEPNLLLAQGDVTTMAFYTVAFAGVVGSAFGLILLAKRAAEQSLADALRQTETILGTLTTGVAILDADRIVRVNPALAAMLETTPGALEGEPATRLFPSAEHYDSWRRAVTAALADDGRHTGEVELVRRGGGTCWAWTQSAALNWHDGHRQVVVSVTDITEWKQAQGDLEQRAATDELTGLLNRRTFLERAAVELSRADRTGQPVCIALVDLDRLKEINDSRGHAAGDAALETLARACTRALRDVDVIARLGGDEFAVVLPHTSLAHGGAVMERVLAELRAEQADDVPGGRVGASVGVAQYIPPENLEAVLARADAAMYAAKAQGRGSVALGQPL